MNKISPIQIYLINLDSSKDRLELVSSQLNTLKLEFTRIPAVLGKTLPKEVIKRISPNRFNFKYRSQFTRELLPSEIGCFLSHRNCWEELLKSSSDWALILEDDIIISNRLNDIIHNLSWIPKTSNIIQLSTLIDEKRIYIKKNVNIQINSELRLVSPVSGVLGSQGYLISRAAAEYAIKISEIIPCPLDHFLFSPCFDFYKKYPYDKVMPSVIKEHRILAAASSIGERDQTHLRKLRAPYWIRHSPHHFIMNLRAKSLMKTGELIKPEFIE